MEVRLLTLDAAQVSLYEIVEGSSTRTQPYGEPDAEHPIFANAEAQSLRLLSRLEERVIRPTGYRYPVIKHVGEEHEISIERVWLHRTSEGGESNDADERRNKLYVLRIVWLEPPPKNIALCVWKSRTYYGVTIPNWDLRTDVEMLAFTEAQTLKAAFYKHGSGAGEPPAL